MRPSSLIAAVLAIAGLGCGPAAAAHLLVDGDGRLIGAEGVVTPLGIYDITLHETSCVALYNGCDGPEDVDFPDLDLARSVGQAVLEQVLIDGPAGNFRSDPTAIFGCSDPLRCYVVIPAEVDGAYDGMWAAAPFLNLYHISLGLPGSGVASSWTTRVESMALRDDSVLASFERVGDADVPLPAALWLLLGGLGGLAVAGRRRIG
ncbi:hypothetical protein LNKW23_04250 [Paralimibaculum aggregatum]|uniref:VPLPA-CTERM sorting domain-containing protein n=1 Tax=Paralimibaculum aggregatum TaxID=3036245 RepID=A0ABQ6LCW4_9RHOB|nr:VPLPA-CTERM sorting domain-containing protein [Limibaculum sp. NKW23]GMG81213.1 hypothetical protein LNKW23_04250 [Limibaculum sp. NKW23]